MVVVAVVWKPEAYELDCDCGWVGFGRVQNPNIRKILGKILGVSKKFVKS